MWELCRQPSAAFSLSIKVLRGQHERAGFVLWDVQDAVKAERLVVSRRVVNEVEDNETLLPGGLTRAAADLLKVDYLREGRTGHQEHLDVRAVPALVQQVACAEHAELALGKRVEASFPIRRAHPARNASRGNAFRSESLSQILAVSHVDTEGDCFAARNVIPVGLDDQLVARRNEHASPRCLGGCTEPG